MKQAIEEGFILDVLKNYTPVDSYYKLVKKTEDDPEFDIKKAQKKLRRYVESHDHAIRLKAEIMVDHFLRKSLFQVASTAIQMLADESSIVNRAVASASACCLRNGERILCATCSPPTRAMWPSPRWTRQPGARGCSTHCER
jgi:hypothetical protein